MELTRIIHPVGQGGFYSETFNNDSQKINVIYDCGGNCKSSIESYIENYYPGQTEKTIDAVFISHLHDDHINGLDFLLKNNHVKHLFLPQLTDDEKIELLLYSIINTGYVTDVIRQLLFGDMNNGTRIISVSHDDGDNHVNGETYEIDLNMSNGINKNNIPSGTKIGIWNEWLFIPYNPPISKNQNDFYNYLKQELHITDDFTPEEIPSIVMKKGLNTIKKVYEGYFNNDHNAYSMTLFSGLVKPHPYYDYCDDCFCEMNRPCHFCRIEYRKKRYCKSPNCLYMGDYDTKKQFTNLRRFYDYYWKTIASVQSPHHGSRNNFVPSLYEYAHKAFISVGERNRYHHPNVDTLIGVESMRCQPLIVTENISTMRMYHYSF